MVKRPAGRTPGEAEAERDEIKHTSRSETAAASQVFHLIVTAEPLFQAHADLRAAGDAVRAGLIDHGTGLRLTRRAEKRIRAAQMARGRAP